MEMSCRPIGHIDLLLKYLFRSFGEIQVMITDYLDDLGPGRRNPKPKNLYFVESCFLRSQMTWIYSVLGCWSIPLA